MAMISDSDMQNCYFFKFTCDIGHPIKGPSSHTSSQTRQAWAGPLHTSPPFSDILNTPYEGLNLANQNVRKFGVFERKLVGSHSIFILICFALTKRRRGAAEKV